MKVYIAMQYLWNDVDVMAVFSSKEKADQFFKEHKDCDYIIEEEVIE